MVYHFTAPAPQQYAQTSDSIRTETAVKLKPYVSKVCMLYVDIVRSFSNNNSKNYNFLPVVPQTLQTEDVHSVDELGFF